MASTLIEHDELQFRALVAGLLFCTEYSIQKIKSPRHSLSMWTIIFRHKEDRNWRGCRLLVKSGFKKAYDKIVAYIDKFRKPEDDLDGKFI